MTYIIVRKQTSLGTLYYYVSRIVNDEEEWLFSAIDYVKSILRIRQMMNANDTLIADADCPSNSSNTHRITIDEKIT